MKITSFCLKEKEKTSTGNEDRGLSSVIFIKTTENTTMHDTFIIVCKCVFSKCIGIKLFRHFASITLECAGKGKVNSFAYFDDKSVRNIDEKLDLTFSCVAAEAGDCSKGKKRKVKCEKLLNHKNK